MREGNTHYSLASSPLATLAQVRVWGEGMRQLLAPHGVCVTVVCPGFIETAMTDIIEGTHPMPFKVSLSTAIAGTVGGYCCERG